MPNQQTKMAGPSDSAILAARTLPELFAARVALTPDRVAYRQHEGGRWVDWTWRRVSAEMSRWRAALAAEKLAPGARIATIMRSGVNYVLVDQATLALGLAIVPLHVTDNPKNVGFILHDSEISVLFIDDAGLLGRARARGLRHPHVETDRDHRAGKSRRRSPRRPPRRSRLDLARRGARLCRGRRRQSVPKCWRRSSTPRGPPAGPRASCSPTTTWFRTFFRCSAWSKAKTTMRSCPSCPCRTLLRERPAITSPSPRAPRSRSPVRWRC